MFSVVGWSKSKKLDFLKIVSKETFIRLSGIIINNIVFSLLMSFSLKLNVKNEIIFCFFWIICLMAFQFVNSRLCVISDRVVEYNRTKYYTSNVLAYVLYMIAGYVFLLIFGVDDYITVFHITLSLCMYKYISSFELLFFSLIFHIASIIIMVLTKEIRMRKKV